MISKNTLTKALPQVLYEKYSTKSGWEANIAQGKAECHISSWDQTLPNISNFLIDDVLSEQDTTSLSL